MKCNVFVLPPKTAVSVNWMFVVRPLLSPASSPVTVVNVAVFVAEIAARTLLAVIYEVDAASVLVLI